VFAHLVKLALIVGLSVSSSITTAQSNNPPNTFLEGYYSRQGNKGSPAATSGHSIYLKFYPDQRVALLYIPYPYSKTLQPSKLDEIFSKLGDQINPGSYVKDNFDLLEEPVVVNMERYQTKGNRVAFECSGSAPCLGEFDNSSMTLSKPGVVGDHIIKFDKVNPSP